jgi:hypothetical protein
MSGRGNCYDNAMVLRRENSPLDCFLILLTFFKTIKSELIWPVAWQSRQQAENAVARYIDGFHNPVRRHSSLGFQRPIAFKRKAREMSQTLSTRTGQVQSRFSFASVAALARVGVVSGAMGGWNTDPFIPGPIALPVLSPWPRVARLPTLSSAVAFW